MSIELEKIADHFCPSDSNDEPSFPNATDSDIWKAGFEKGVEVVTKAIIRENSITTQAWICNKIKTKFGIK